MMIKYASIAIIMSSFLSSTASASPCELHVWPTTRLNGATMGSGMTGVLPALMAGNTDKQVAVLDALLNPARQVDQYQKLDLRATFDLPPDTEISFHEPVIEGWNNKGRNSESNAPCYYEFRMDEIFFNRHPLYGKDILVFLTFRAFGPGNELWLSSSDRVRTKMPTFPKKVESDAVSVAAAADLINQAFANDIRIFADRVKPRLRNKR